MGDAVSLHLRETESGTVCREPECSFQQTGALSKVPSYCFGRLLLAFFVFLFIHRPKPLCSWRIAGFLCCPPLASLGVPALGAGEP